MATGKKLVIVESPAKAKTIAGYLGSDYVVESSIGHIRDLPNRAAEIPKDSCKRSHGHDSASTSSDDFEPLYVVDPDKKTKVAELKRALKDADELLLATDEDREGEAIAWHLLEVLQPKVPGAADGLPRDHAATRSSARSARRRAVDQRLVDAQETRRILDRLYGYEVSPVLWRKVMHGLSAGRVQSVAVRLVVERERERMRVRRRPATGTSSGRFDPGALRGPARRGRRQAGRAGPRLRAETGTLKDADLARLDEAEPARSPPSSTAPPSRSARPTRSRTRAGRPRRS